MTVNSDPEIGSVLAAEKSEINMRNDGNSPNL